MLRGLLLAASCILLSVAAGAPERAPVLVELFTSEGCSSCPPADRLLGLLDSQVIVLSEHVEYWDSLGWKDRFSSAAFTERQSSYAHSFGIDGPYTPQMVVDGAAQFTGSDSRQAQAEIQKAAGRPRIDISLVRSAAGVRIETQGAAHDADLWLALADSSASTQVKNGENKGHELRHVAVVRSLRRLASLKRGASFAKQVDLPATSAGQRVVVFLQETGQARVLGVAMLPAPAM
jgi:hypothetical protein